MIQNQIGNTFSIEWPVYIEEVTLSEANLTLYIEHNRYCKEIDFTVEDNTISFTIEGKDQRIAGCYDLILYLNEGEDDQMKLVEKDAFRLYR